MSSDDSSFDAADRLLGLSRHPAYHSARRMVNAGKANADIIARGRNTTTKPHLILVVGTIPYH